MAFSVANLPKFLVKNLMPALRVLSPRTALRVVSDLGRIEYALNPSRRWKYRAAVRKASQHFGESWLPGKTACDLAANQFRWRARDLLLDGLSDEGAKAYFHVTGQDHLRQAFDRKKGVVLLFNHFGPFLMPAHWIVRQGYPLRWFTERPRQISKLLSKDFADDGPLGQKSLFISRRLTPKEGSTAIRKAVRVLQSGMIVQLAGDVRWAGPRAVSGELLGTRYQFTTTWITLAAMSGAPVVPVYGVMKPDGTCDLEFLPSFDVSPNALKTDEAERLVHENLAAIEMRIRQYPENSLDYLFWNGADAMGGESLDAA
jgi:lauroyl/myristoyl acyltransferase